MSFDDQTLDTPSRPPEIHMAAFNANDATLELATQLKNIRGFALGRCGAPGTTETLSIDEPVTDFGEIVVDDGGFITIRRAATTTSGLIVSVVLYGI